MADSEVNRRKILKGAAAGSLAVAAAAAAGVAHAQPSTTASPTPSGTPTPSATPTAPGTTTPSQTTTPAPSATPSTSAAPLTTASAPGQNRVAILGGGPAGLTAAHELAERGFHVTVYERRGWGGKARSMDTPLPVAGGRKPLPGEHGFRFFPGYYRCIPDTMSRIPFEGNKNGVRDNLVPAPTVTGEQKGGNITIPFGFSTGDVATAANLEWLVNTLAGGMYWIPKLPYGDLITFAKRLLVYFTSCDDRRNQQWEKTPFKEFAKIKPGSNPNYQLLISTLARTLVAANENIASAKTICGQGENFLLNMLGRNNGGLHTDNVLNSPTNEVWIDPWIDYLKQINVDLQLGFDVQSLTVKDGKIASATLKDPSGATSDVEADWFVLALPPERVTALFSTEILQLDPDLDKIKKLFVDWMTGIQFYLNTDEVEAPGHIGWIESPWRMSGIFQSQFWKKRHDIAKDFGDGKVKGILSVDISDWHTPGLQNKKPADQLSPEELAKEAWYQITKTSDHIKSNHLVGWFLDPGMAWDGSKYTNSDPLLINTAGSWENRPGSITKIPNMFLAGDYCRSEIDLATMEGACEAGRNATNGILDASGSTSKKAMIWPKVTIREFDGLRSQDAGNFRNGRPNIFDN
ncbi:MULTISPECIES: hydroxysqualene dehydroxylase [Nocardia]|uniref:hydroxysqualene dehydroxylase n=1 Tax=Nocardia TaxID=1817 RepID=UPI00068F78FE|nr:MULTISPECIES: FAD-dependent oxidoreductase [Nocardia]PPI96611.1 FAD-dependent oxidoreductase [Nocardia nova]